MKKIDITITDTDYQIKSNINKEKVIMYLKDIIQDLEKNLYCSGCGSLKKGLGHEPESIACKRIQEENIEVFGKKAQV